jgi:23S rRNA (uracil747-C5)-methyltransferase
MSQNHPAYENASCHYHSAGMCRSCTLLDTAAGTRLSSKLASLTGTLTRCKVHPSVLRDAVTLPSPWHTRHKVKMSVSGSVANPVIGITRQDRTSQELAECPLSTELIADLLRHLASVITTYSLTPYDIAARTGELKYIIITTTSRRDQGILRFIMRSREALPHVQAAATDLTSHFPWIKVISCNIQPIPAAILEGSEEIPITDNTVIREEFASLPLFFTPQSFMQVTPAIAQQLYIRAAQLVSKVSPHRLLDLFCGVGGFSLSVAPYCREILGIEISAQAIGCAQRAADELGLHHVHFQATDVEAFIRENRDYSPDMIVVNPPRRGLSEDTLRYFMHSRPQHILYSSCNPETFARDAQTLLPSYTLEELTPFDMFPMTHHWEVLGLFSTSRHSEKISG